MPLKLISKYLVTNKMTSRLKSTEITSFCVQVWNGVIILALADRLNQAAPL